MPLTYLTTLILLACRFAYGMSYRAHMAMGLKYCNIKIEFLNVYYGPISSLEISCLVLVCCWYFDSYNNKREFKLWMLLLATLNSATWDYDMIANLSLKVI